MAREVNAGALGRRMKLVGVNWARFYINKSFSADDTALGTDCVDGCEWVSFVEYVADDFVSECSKLELWAAIGVGNPGERILLLITLLWEKLIIHCKTLNRIKKYVE